MKKAQKYFILLDLPILFLTDSHEDATITIRK